MHLYIVVVTFIGIVLFPKVTLSQSKTGKMFEFEISEQKEIAQPKGLPGKVKPQLISSKIKFNYFGHDAYTGENPKARVEFLDYTQNSADNGASDSSVNMVRQDSFQNRLAAFRGAKFSLEIAKSGKVNSMEGYDAFRSDFDRLSDGAGGNSAVFFPREYFMQLFEKISAILPDSEISISSTWTVDQDVVVSDPLIIAKGVYRVVEMNSDAIHVRATYNVDQSFEFQPGKSMVMEGHGEGDFIVNSKTGILVRSYTSVAVAGSVTGGQTNLTTNVRYTTEITSKTIN